MITNIKQFLLLENISQMRQFLKSIGEEEMEKEFDFVKNKFTKTPNLIAPFVKMMFDKNNKPHINKEEFELVSNWILKNKHLIKELPKNIQNYNSLEELQDDIRKTDTQNAYKSFYNSLYRNMKDQIDELKDDTLDNFIFLINKFLELPEDKRKEFPPLKYFEANNLKLSNFTDAIINFLESGEVNSSKESVLKYVTDEELDIRYNKNNILIIQTNDREIISKLGSQNWCIVYAQDIYFSRYVGDDVLGTQYIIYNFNLPASSDLSQYGISIKIDGSTFNGGCQDKGNKGHSLDDICNYLNINRQEIFTTNYKDIYNKIEKAKKLLIFDNESELINNLLKVNDETILNILFNGVPGVDIQPFLKPNSSFIRELIKRLDSLNDYFINIISEANGLMYYLTSHESTLQYVGDLLIKINNPYKSLSLISDINRSQDLSKLIPIKEQLMKYINYLIKKGEDSDTIENIQKSIKHTLENIYTHSRENIDNIQEIVNIYTQIHSDDYIMDNIFSHSNDDNIYDFILSEYPISYFTNDNDKITKEDINEIIDICKKSNYYINYDILEYILEIDVDSNRNKEQSVNLIYEIYNLIPKEQFDENVEKLSNAWLLHIHTLSEKNDILKDNVLKDVFTKQMYNKLKLDETGYSTIKITEYSDFEDYFDGDINFQDTYDYFDWETDKDGWSYCLDNIDLNNMLLLATSLYNDGVLPEYEDTIKKYNTQEYINIFKENSRKVIFSDDKYSDLKKLDSIIDTIFNDSDDIYMEHEDTIDEYKSNLNIAYNRAGSAESESEWFKEIDNELSKIFDVWENNKLVDWEKEEVRYRPLNLISKNEDIIDELAQQYGDDFTTDNILDIYLEYEGKLPIPSGEYHSPDSDTINDHISEILHEEHSPNLKVVENVIIKFKDFIIKKD